MKTHVVVLVLAALLLWQPEANAEGADQALSPNEQAIEKMSLSVTTDYILGPEDVLEITVWRSTDLSKVVTVRPDGRISLPLIGDVSAMGKTATQLPFIAHFLRYGLCEAKHLGNTANVLGNAKPLVTATAVTLQRQ